MLENPLDIVIAVKMVCMCLTVNGLVCCVSENGAGPSPVQYGQVSGRQQIGMPAGWPQFVQQLNKKLATHAGRTSSETGQSQIPAPPSGNSTAQQGKTPGLPLGNVLGDRLGGDLMQNASSPAGKRREQEALPVKDQSAKENSDKSQLRGFFNRIMFGDKAKMGSNEMGRSRLQEAVGKKQQTEKLAPAGMSSRYEAEQSDVKQAEVGERKTRDMADAGSAVKTDRKPAQQEIGTRMIPRKRNVQPGVGANGAAQSSDDKDEYNPADVEVKVCLLYRVACAYIPDFEIAI